MSRRGENIRKRKDGRWEARYPNGVTENGKIKYASIYGRSYREVKEKRRHMIQHPISAAHPNSPLCFGEVLQLWLDDNRIHLKDATLYRYNYLIEKHILPELGTMRVDKLTGPVINAFLAQKLSHGRLDGQGELSAAYVRSIMLIIRSALNFASENQLCPPLLTNISKPTVPTRELLILNRSDQKKLETFLLAGLDPTKLGVYIALYTGLRIGEICALTWEDIDLENRVIYVRHTVVRVRCEENGTTTTKNKIDHPKTKSSFRCIPICSALLDTLFACSAEAGSRYVASANADFVSPRTFAYRYSKLLKAAGISHINFHALRHTFATRCIEAGMDVKTLSEILGHSNVSITLNTYVHSSMDMKRLQLEKLVRSSA